MDLLIALASRPGELVSKDELIALAWPGALVSDGNLSVQVHALRQAVADGGVRIATTPGRGYRLIAEGAGAGEAAGQAPDPASDNAVATGSPAPPGRLIGREAEIEAVGEGLRSSRCVSLVGPGGVGKTSVALRAARDLTPLYRDGVGFVQLTTLASKAQVEEAVAGCVGLTLKPGQAPIDALRRYLRTRRLLLLVDNCEHVLPICAELIERLLEACPEVNILATSRERLAIGEEAVLHLAPLGYPRPGRALSAEQALSYPSVQLLVERATALDQAFRLTDADAPYAAEVCARLDGIALAIELAAARLRTLSLPDLASRLEARFSLLTRGQRTASAQHQTLRALIDWSYDLLTPDEQLMLRRLSVFSGGWTLETSLLVAGAPPLTAEDDLDRLSSLVEKSLVVCDQAGGRRRYRLLETMHVYARDKAAEAGEPELPRRHAQAMVRLAVRAGAAWPRASTETWLAPLRPELDNFRSALDWAFGPEGEEALGQALLAHGYALWAELGLVAEQRRRLSIALARVDADTAPGLEARLRLGFGMGAARLGYRPNLADLQRASALFEVEGDRLNLAAALVWSGVAQLDPGQPALARAPLQRALELLRSEPPSKMLGHALNAMAAVRFFTGDVAGAESLFGEAIALLRDLGDTSAARTPMGNLAELYMLAGDVDAAIAAGERMVQACRQEEDVTRLARALVSLGGYRLVRGDIAQAQTLALEALRRNSELGQEMEAVQSLEIIAAAAAAQGELDRAARLCGHACAWREHAGVERDAAERDAFERLQSSLSSLPAVRRAALVKEGWTWSEEQVLQAALEA